MEEIIHHYKHKHWFGKTECGVDIQTAKDHSDILRFVTCKKCIKNAKTKESV